MSIIIRRVIATSLKLNLLIIVQKSLLHILSRHCYLFYLLMTVIRLSCFNSLRDFISNLITFFSAKITLDSLSVGDILSAAAYLRMPSIVEACQSFLVSTLSLENCIRYLQVSV